MQITVELYFSISELMVEYKIAQRFKRPVKIVKDEHSTK